MSLNCDKCACVDLCQSFINTDGCLLEESKETKERFLKERIAHMQSIGTVTPKDIRYIQRLITELKLHCEISTLNNTLNIRIIDDVTKRNSVIQPRDFREIETFLNDKFKALGVKLKCLTFNNANKEISITYINEEGKSIRIDEYY